MFEVTFYGAGGLPLYRDVCKVGDLLPTIATQLQRYEKHEGKYKYQRNYAVQWCWVRE